MNKGRNPLIALADELDVPRRDKAVDYAPPAHRSAAYHVDMDQLAHEIDVGPKSNLKARFCRLTYGEMMEACAEIIAAAKGQGVGTAEDLAKVLHTWAKTPD